MKASQRAKVLKKKREGNVSLREAIISHLQEAISAFGHSDEGARELSVFVADYILAKGGVK